MGRLWAAVISQTSQSAWKLVAFGGLCIAASAVAGNVFTSLVGPVEPKDKKKSLQDMNYDDRRFTTAREQRLSGMIKDMLEGQGDAHWNAAMRGTIVQHPEPESKTQGRDSEALAAAKEAANSSKPKGWWSR